MNKAQKEKIARKLRSSKGLEPKLKGDMLQKGKGSLHSTMKHRIDVAGQDSYKEENS